MGIYPVLTPIGLTNLQAGGAGSRKQGNSKVICRKSDTRRASFAPFTRALRKRYKNVFNFKILPDGKNLIVLNQYVNKVPNF